jgi:hypothetical protein
MAGKKTTTGTQTRTCMRRHQQERETGSCEPQTQPQGFLAAMPELEPEPMPDTLAELALDRLDPQPQRRAPRERRQLPAPQQTRQRQQRQRQADQQAQPPTLLTIPTPHAALTTQQQIVRSMALDLALQVNEVSLLKVFGDAFTYAQRYAIRDALRTVYLPILAQS